MAETMTMEQIEATLRNGGDLASALESALKQLGTAQTKLGSAMQALMQANLREQVAELDRNRLDTAQRDLVAIVALYEGNVDPRIKQALLGVIANLAARK